MASPLLTFRFRRSRSAACAEALSLAKMGDFRQVQHGKLIMYEATFILTEEPEALNRLVRLNRLVASMKGSEFLVDGQPRRHAHGVLPCYQQSLSLKDPTAYCWASVNMMQALPHVKVGRDTFPRRTSIVRKTYFPCRLAARIWGNFDLTHPASLRAQAEAILIKEGCEWCPRLRLDEWEIRYGKPEPLPLIEVDTEQQ